MNVSKAAAMLDQFVIEALYCHAPIRRIKVKQSPAPNPSKAIREMWRRRDNARRRGDTLKLMCCPRKKGEDGEVI
jgi:hypothetical protein